MAQLTPRPRSLPRPPGALALRLLLLLAGLLALALARAPSGAQEASPARSALEHRVKAAFLYKFAAYVEWPPARQDSGPLVIGVAGADDVARELSQLAAGRAHAARPAVVRLVHEGDALPDVHVLFIGRGYGRSVEHLLRRAQQGSVLTVTESDDAFSEGSVINFKLVDGRVRFDVSLPAADRSKLRLSSRLLGVAHQVHRTHS
jgi:hypothetical protein